MKRHPLIISAVTMLGMLSLSEGCSEEAQEPIDIYEGSYMEIIPSQGKTEDTFEAWWEQFPYTEEIQKEGMTEKRVDGGKLENEIRLEIQGNEGRLTITEIKEEAKTETTKMRHIIKLEGGQYQGQMIDGTFYGIEIKADGVYQNGKIAIALEDYTYEYTTIATKSLGTKLTNLLHEGKTENANNGNFKIETATKTFLLERENANTYGIRETSPEERDLGALEKK